LTIHQQRKIKIFAGSFERLLVVLKTNRWYFKKRLKSDVVVNQQG